MLRAEVQNHENADGKRRGQRSQQLEKRFQSAGGGADRDDTVLAVPALDSGCPARIGTASDSHGYIQGWGDWEGLNRPPF